LGMTKVVGSTSKAQKGNWVI